ncbi:hypothetical protein BDQ12DRAFT_683016 [Crucibulum laeve]|uniref:Uncharacterized protein n=1 Tax=Crucibulum laeve TaxID=68775 RepID=A0A5C3M2W3_9AGAR|nr:hypothetical protein BDQ12DRAFT_683016 [Crucibulum laeve]
MGSFSVPLTFPAISTLRADESEAPDSRNIIEASLLGGEPTTLEYFNASQGAAIGCSNGTLYVFHPSCRAPEPPQSPVGIVQVESVSSPSSSSRAQSPLRVPQFSTHSRSASFARRGTPSVNSRSTSPSTATSHSFGLTSPSPFPVNTSARSRVVSGITAEKVEAPKNYVDFDEEPGKLKEMLKGRKWMGTSTSASASASSTSVSTIGSESPRKSDEKRRSASLTLSKGALSNSSTNTAAHMANTERQPRRRKDPPKSLLSATNSLVTTPHSFSAPASPRELCDSHQHTHELALRYHIVPSTSGSMQQVRALGEGKWIVVLQETGHVHIFSWEDGSCVASASAQEVAYSPTKHKEREGLAPLPEEEWNWCSLSVSRVDGETVILVTASPSSSTAPSETDPERPATQSLSVLFSFRSSHYGTTLLPLNHWNLPSPAGSIGIHVEGDSTSTLYAVSPTGNLQTYSLHIERPTLPTHSIIPSLENHGHSLAIPNPFKSMKSKSAEELPLLDSGAGNSSNGKQKDKDKEVIDKETVLLGEMHDLGPLLVLDDDKAVEDVKIHKRSGEGKTKGLTWTQKEIAVFEYDQMVLTVIYRSSLPSSSSGNLKVANWIEEDRYALVYEDKVEIYHLRLVDANNDNADEDVMKSGLTQISPDLQSTLSLKPFDTCSFTVTLEGAAELVVTKIAEDAQREIGSYSLLRYNGKEIDMRSLWRTSALPNPKSTKQAPRKIEITSMLPLELDVIAQGYTDGHIRQHSLSQLCCRTSTASTPSASASLSSHSFFPSPSPSTFTSYTLTAADAQKTSNITLPGSITALHTVYNPRTKERLIVGGADDGSIAFWSGNNFELSARWIVFTTPLLHVMQFHEDKTGPLRGCVLCISQDGTIAVIVIDGFHFLYLVPGSSSPLQRICLGGNNLLLIYADQRARLWDVQTKEFWRSMSLDKAEEMLGQGGWSDLSLEKDACIQDSIWKAIPGSSEGMDTVSSLSLDLERLVTESIAVTKTISTSLDQTRVILQTLDRLRLVLSTLLTLGLNEDVDSICHGKLGIYPSSVIVGFSSPKSTILYRTSRPLEPWCISGAVTAARIVSIIVILRAMSLFEELLEGANTVISFYATSIGPCVGPQYQSPNLPYLGRLWFNTSNEIRHAIRILFDSTVARMSDEEASGIAEQWQHHLPCLQPDSERESTTTALSLFICGYVASEKYSLLSTSALTDIAKSITLYLHDEKSIYRVLAIDLCSRGFHIWQHYMDAMEILRSLFSLATNSKKDFISVQNVNGQARVAVLSIASNNTPLFMTTLCLDILAPSTLEHRRSVMQIVAFLIRKRPLVLQPNLPRLMEAVVKSLDPNSTVNRDAVLDTATEIIGYVVKTFPTVDFHMANQRLAVGSNEGAVIMYDLKTAIRLYVLEGHKKQITACSFSPDGRRLVTLSLEESVVLVWKVGSSFSSFFNPGAPPRQGHGGSQPFKTLNFNIGGEANMTIAETFEKVRFEWVADRSVKLKIREVVLTFST